MRILAEWQAEYVGFARDEGSSSDGKPGEMPSYMNARSGLSECCLRSSGCSLL